MTNTVTASKTSKKYFFQRVAHFNFIFRVLVGRDFAVNGTAEIGPRIGPVQHT